MLLAKFCMKCGFFRLAKRLALLEVLLLVDPAAVAAASPWTFSDKTVLKAEVLVSTWGNRAWVGLEAPLLRPPPPGKAALARLAASATEAAAIGSTSDSLFLGLAFSTKSLHSPLRNF